MPVWHLKPIKSLKKSEVQLIPEHLYDHVEMFQTAVHNFNESARRVWIFLSNVSTKDLTHVVYYHK